MGYFANITLETEDGPVEKVIRDERFDVNGDSIDARGMASVGVRMPDRLEVEDWATEEDQLYELSDRGWRLISRQAWASWVPDGGWPT